MKKIVVLLLLLGCAQSAFADTLERAKVLEVLKEEKSVILEDFTKRGVDVLTQTISAEILTGVEKGKKVTIENDYTPLKEGDRFFLEKTSSADTGDIYTLRERDRQWPIIILLLIFAGVIILFGKKQGVRSLLSLAGSFLVIMYGLLPMLAKGYSPIIVSVSFAAVILFVAIYFTHGFNRESNVAFLGTVMAVVLTGLLAFFSVGVMHLTGFNTEETMLLDFGSGIQLDFHGLLLGGILIGVLGILDDIAVTQAAVVSEIYKSAPHLSKKQVYKKAMRVGREHVSALVNTLVLAYTGASLPLLLLISERQHAFNFVISQELFATEIVRTIVGSIGLVLTVPITTLLAVRMLKGYKGKHSSHTHHHE